MKSIGTIGITIWLVAISPTKETRAQTIDLKSSTLAILTASERDRFLNAHNQARREVRVGPVEWSEDLSKEALESLREQKDALIGAAKEHWNDGRAVIPAHRAGNKYGENVAGWVGGRSRSAEFAVELWLSEKRAFDKLNASDPYRVGDEEGKSETDALGKERPIIVGHFTAIVWSATTQIGAAKVSFDLMDDQGTTRSYTAIVCVYNPPGNRRGEKPY
jgi:pathogenesis-related protein 1